MSDAASTFNDAGNALFAQRRFAEALANFDRALALKPDFPEALGNRGNALKALGRLDEAVASYDLALALRPAFAGVLVNRGNAMFALRRFDEALASYDRAISADPAFADAHRNRAHALTAMGKLEDALANLERAVTLRPQSAQLHAEFGKLLLDLMRLEEAVARCDHALALQPRLITALVYRGNALLGLGRAEAALDSYEQALAVNPDLAEAHYNRGNALSLLKRYEEALASHKRALELKPNHALAFGGVMQAALQACDWDATEWARARLEDELFRKGSIMSPFVLLGYDCTPSAQLKCATLFVRSDPQLSFASSSPRRIVQRDRLRIGYLSSDFRQHAIGWLTAELFELHDQTRFEVFGISHGADDGSAIRARIASAFTHFEDVRGRGDAEIADLIRSREIDIAIDLNGSTQNGRPGILARRPAPIQVSYLGYPGTMGADFVDYIIADPVVLPFDQQPYFTERIVHLPDCYQVNDSKRAIAAEAPSREDEGLPRTGFVFCCFNNSFKITRDVFEIWTRLLKQVEGSVLWLMHDADTSTRNLRREAEARGVAPERLVFAGRAPQERHLARHALADLFLDTLPYNAHTTCSDALWAGLPVLTRPGATMPGRVAASLLKAVGLPELIAEDEAGYEALALKLAREPARLGALKARLRASRSTAPLFDTRRFTRNFETALEIMHQRCVAGDSPAPFAVSP